MAPLALCEASAGAASQCPDRCVENNNIGRRRPARAQSDGSQPEPPVARLFYVSPARPGRRRGTLSQPVARPSSPSRPRRGPSSSSCSTGFGRDLRHLLPVCRRALGRRGNETETETARATALPEITTSRLATIQAADLISSQRLRTAHLSATKLASIDDPPIGRAGPDRKAAD